MTLHSVPFTCNKHYHYNSVINKKRFYSGSYRYLFFLFLLNNVLGSNFAFAQWSTDPNINTTIRSGAESASMPAIIPGDNGSVIIAWSDSRNGVMNTDIFVQKLNAAGQQQWTINGLAVCTAANDQSPPFIVSDGEGGAIIAWTDYRHSVRPGINSDIYAQRITSSGQIAWMKDGIPVCTTPDDQSIYSMTSDRNGGAVLVWPDNRNGSYSNIYVQNIKKNGVLAWTSNGLQVCSQPNSQGFPDLLVNVEGNTIVTWEEDRIKSGRQIFAQMITPGGKLKWNPDGVIVCSASQASAGLPTIVLSGEHDAIIAWLDYRRSDRSDIYAQRISKDGVIKWQVNGVEIGRAAGWQRGPQMVSDDAGGAILTWDDYRSGTNANTDTYSQRVDSNGVIQWPQYGAAICTAEGRQYWSGISPDGAGGAIITWGDSRGGAVNADVYAQHINSAGATEWMENGILISSARGRQYLPAIVSFPGRGAVITWNDARNGGDPGNGIYAQNINLNGKIGCFTPVITKQPLTTQTIWQGTTAAGLMVAVTGDQLKYQWFSNTTASTTGAVNLNPSATETSFIPSAAKEGTHYYYCRITSNCDTVYSDFAQVTVNIPITKLEVKVSPNPTESFFTVTVKNPDDGIIYIRLFDMLGRLVEYQQGRPSQSFKLAEKLAAGIYLIEVRQGEEVVVTKAVKQ